MIEIIKNIIILILSIISGSIPIVTVVVKRYRQAKLDGVEKLAKKIESNEYDKVIEQRRIIKENSDILFCEFLDVFCDKLKLSMDSKEAKYYKALILDSVRRVTDLLMEEVIKSNKIAQREGDDWVSYKKSKFNLILKKVIEHISQIYRDDLIGIAHQEVIEKCRAESINTYMNNIEPMFESIREIAIFFFKKTEDLERVLNDLKNGKKKVE
jgi:hypothetical protein